MASMITPNFEIKVALLGYVSVGKTTVLNAMLRDKFSEVSMRRTTAGINFFRIVKVGTKTEEESMSWSAVADEKTKKAPDVLKAIVAANQELREARRIEEKWFNVEVEEPLCEMRKDTSLVLVDIPGINEANSDNIYTKYVEDNWKSFDCVVAVMDARQGVNTEEQLALLRLMKKNLSTKKDVPIIVLFNKVDEPDDAEQIVLVNEARDKVAEIFGLPVRKNRKAKLESNAYPVFIATSAVHAFFYRTASLLSYNDFKAKFDMDLIDKIGREEAGRYKWKKLSKDGKYQLVYKAICENSNYNERLETTNFDKYLNSLSLAIGGTDVQKKLLEKQVDVAIQALMAKENISTCHLRTIYDKSVLLGKSLEPIKQTFWSMYKTSRDNAMKTFVNDARVECLAEIAQLLWNYFSFARALKWTVEEEIIRKEVCALVRLQIGSIVNAQGLTCVEQKLGIDDSQDFCSNCIHNQSGTRSTNTKKAWRKLSLFDWLSILDSILLMSQNDCFREYFGREGILLPQLRSQFASYLTAPSTCYCSSCGPYNRNYNGYNNYRKCPQCKNQHSNYAQSCRHELYREHVKGQRKLKYANGTLSVDGGGNDSGKVAIPQSRRDEKHWGHITWKCCKLLEALKESSANGTQ